MLDYAIAGAGIAGLSTALELVRRGHSNGRIYEKEPAPAQHASTRNSGMIHHYHPDPEMRAHIEKAVTSLKTFQNEINGSFFRQTSSLFLFPSDLYERLEDDPNRTGGRNKQSSDSIPASLKPDVDHDGTWCEFSKDGLIDSESLVRTILYYLEDHGVPVVTGEAVESGEYSENGWELTTSRETSVRTHCLVNTAGEWANQFGQSVGAQPKELTPLARHLFLIKEQLLPLEWGFYWDHLHDIYFRSRSDGTLISICDNHPVEAGENPPISSPEDLLKERLIEYYPQFRNVTLDEWWACRRTRHTSGTPLITRDPELDRFIWVAGLEGHGITACEHIGSRAAGCVEEIL